MTNLVGLVPQQKMKAVIERHTLNDAGMAWVEENRPDGMVEADVQDLVAKGMAILSYREVNHNLILNDGLDFIADCILDQFSASVSPLLPDGMALGSDNTPETGTQTTLLGAIAGSFNAFAATFPQEGPQTHQIDFQSFWDTNDPPGAPASGHTIREVAMLKASETGTAVSRISTGLSVDKQDADTLTIKITWSIGTPT